MKILNKERFVVVFLIILIQLFFVPVPRSHAATTPSLGQADSFVILSGTYTNTVGGTTLTGDLGYTTGPAMAPTVSGSTHIADGTYSQAGTDQGAALTNLNGQACTHTFPAGAIDLATDTSHGTLGVYTPGVYCTTTASAASIGAGGITLSGSGTYIFRIDGAFTTVDNSVVTLADGASSCDVFWTPTGATTLGANTTFMGTDIDDAGITIGSTVNWNGRALAFGGTVSTTVDTITTTCSVAPTPTPTATPTSTTTSSSSSTSSYSSSSSGGSAPCTSSGITSVPGILETRRVSPTSVFVSWGPNAGLNNFIVQYGFQNGNWQYNVNVSGFSTTIGGLPANESIWVQVAATDNCVVGSFSASKFIGGASGSSVPRLPNTGGSQVPRLPNTGIDPDDQGIYWKFLAGGLSGLIIFYLVREADILLHNHESF